MGERMQFYETIRNSYGDEATECMKIIAKSYNKMANLKNRRIFLFRCRNEEIFPNCLNIKTNQFQFYTTHHRQKFENNILSKFKVSTLNLIITDTIKQIKTLEINIDTNKNKLNVLLPNDILNTFLKKQINIFEQFFNKIKTINLNKLAKLKNDAQHKTTTKIPVQDSWIENISDTPLPDYAKEILSLGPEFSMPFTNKNDIPVPEIVSNIETSIQNLTTENKDVIRTKCCNMITNFQKNTTKKTIMKKYLKTYKTNLTKRNPFLNKIHNLKS